MPEPQTKPSIWQWSDRWAPEVLHVPDGTGAQPVAISSPYYYAREILSVCLHCVMTADIATRYLNLTLWHAGYIYASFTPRQGLIAGYDRRVYFQRGGMQFLTGFVDNQLYCPLPHNFLWLPHATLQLDVTNGQTPDAYSDIQILSRRWRVA